MLTGCLRLLSVVVVVAPRTLLQLPVVCIGDAALPANTLKLRSSEILKSVMQDRKRDHLP